MDKRIIPLIVGIALISLISSMYSGECLSVDINGLDNIDYYIVENSSNLEGLTIEFNETMANICTVYNYQPDSFTIIFIDNSTNTIIKEIYYSSGGTRNIYIENKTITYVPEYLTINNSFPLNQTDITDPIPEKKSLWSRFWEWLIELIRKIF